MEIKEEDLASNERTRKAEEKFLQERRDKAQEIKDWAAKHPEVDVTFGGTPWWLEVSIPSRNFEVYVVFMNDGSMKSLDVVWDCLKSCAKKKGEQHGN